jgi:hypothetical protein
MGYKHHPVVLDEQARRAADLQLRIADWITAFAGSMNFVYLHVRTRPALPDLKDRQPAGS